MRAKFRYLAVLLCLSIFILNIPVYATGVEDIERMSDSLSDGNLAMNWVSTDNSTMDIDDEHLTWTPALVSSPTATVQLTYQVWYTNPDAQQYEPGEVEIELPYYLYPYRDQTVTGAPFAAISLPQTPNPEIPFTYTTNASDNKIIISNALPITEALNISFQVRYNAAPVKTVPDEAYYIEAILDENGSISESGLTMELLPNFSIYSFYVYQDEPLSEWYSGLGKEPDDFEEYYYCWIELYSSIYTSTDLKRTYEVEFVDDNGELIGFYSSNTSSYPTKHSEATTYTIDSYSASDNTVYALVRFDPELEYIELEANVIAEPLDYQDEKSSFDWLYIYKTEDDGDEDEENEFSVTGKSDYAAGVLSMLDYGEDVPFTWSAELIQQYEESFDLELTQDKWIYRVGSQDFFLTEEDYTLNSVTINGTKDDDMELPVSLYAFYDEAWNLVEECYWEESSYQKAYNLPDGTTQIRLLSAGHESRVRLNVETQLLLKHDSKTFADQTAGTFYHFAVLQVKDTDSGEILNHDSYSHLLTVFNTDTRSAIQAYDAAEYGPALQRARGYVSLSTYTYYNTFYLSNSSASIKNNIDDKRIEFEINTYAYEDWYGTSTKVTQWIYDNDLYKSRDTATFHILVTPGVMISGIKAQTYAGADAQVTNLQTVHDWRESGKTMLIVEVASTDNAYRTTSSVQRIRSGYSLSLYCTLPWNYVHNSIYKTMCGAYQVDGTFEANGYPDNGAYSYFKENQDLFYDLDEDGNLDPEKYNTKYTTGTLNINNTLKYSTNEFTTRVRHGADSAGPFTTQTTATIGDAYEYLIQLDNASYVKDMIIYCQIEEDGEWQGIYEGIDLSNVRTQGVQPVVYYNTLDTAPLDISASSWSTQIPKNMESVRAIAVDLSMTPDGQPHTFEADQTADFILRMRAPLDVNLAGKTTSNKAVIQMSYSTTKNGIYQAVQNTSRQASVILSSEIPTVTISYDWISEDNPTDVEPPAAVDVPIGSIYDLDYQEKTRQNYIFSYSSIKDESLQVMNQWYHPTYGAVCSR